jgi:hypothetical protein
MSDTKDGAAVIGMGAAACAVCCAGPILGLLAATSVTTAVGFALFGLAGVALAAIVGIVLYRRRRGRAMTCATGPETVPLEAPTVRTSR